VALSRSTKGVVGGSFTLNARFAFGQGCDCSGYVGAQDWPAPAREQGRTRGLRKSGGCFHAGRRVGMRRWLIILWLCGASVALARLPSPRPLDLPFPAWPQREVVYLSWLSATVRWDQTGHGTVTLYDNAWRLQTLTSPAGGFGYGYRVGQASSLVASLALLLRTFLA